MSLLSHYLLYIIYPKLLYRGLYNTDNKNCFLNTKSAY